MAEKKAKKAAEESNETPQEHQRRQTKVSRWDLATCKKAARRFDSRAAWSKGAPSSYKAAVARGWDAECTGHMQALEPKAKAKKPVPAHSGKSKTPSRLPKTA